LSEGPEAWSVTRDAATFAILDAFVTRDNPGDAGWFAPSAPLR